MSEVRFSQEFLSNQFFQEQPTGFLAPAKERVGMISHGQAVALGVKPFPGTPVDTGYFPQPNGDLLFRIYAPGIDKVEVHMLNMEPRPNLVLEKQEDGMHVGTFPYDPTFTGATDTDIIFDGTPLLYPWIPIFWHRDRPVNFVEIPEKESEWAQIRHVPHGSVNRELFWSETFGDWQRCYVYTPPGYEKGGEYPILYLQAGSGENEITWEYNGRFAHITDNLIAAGEAVPMLVVVTDGTESYPRETGFGGSLCGNQDMIVNDVIPFIEGKYRVKPGKENRAVAGLSRGGHQAFATALTHPDLFAYIGVFSAYLFHTGDVEDPRYYDKSLLSDPRGFEKEFKIFFRCMGETDHLFPDFEKDNAFFRENGFDALPNYRYATYPHKAHLWGAWRFAYHDFIRFLFRD